MDDDTLDRTLRATDPGAGASERETAMLAHLVARTRTETPSRRPAGHRWRIGVGIGGFFLAGALVAGVTYQDYLLSIPPFAGLGDEEQRTPTGWVMSPVIGGDAGEECVLYPEFRQLAPDQFAAISESVAENPDWDTLGVEAADAAGIPVGSVIDDEDPRSLEYMNAMLRLVHERVQEVLPGLPFQARSNELGAVAASPSFEGWTMSCLAGVADDQ